MGTEILWTDSVVIHRYAYYGPFTHFPHDLIIIWYLSNTYIIITHDYVFCLFYTVIWIIQVYTAHILLYKYINNNYQLTYIICAIDKITFDHCVHNAFNHMCMYMYVWVLNVYHPQETPSQIVRILVIIVNTIIMCTSWLLFHIWYNYYY